MRTHHWVTDNMDVVSQPDCWLIDHESIQFRIFRQYFGWKYRTARSPFDGQHKSQ